LDFTGIEQPDAVFGPSQHARLHQSLGIHGRGRVELAGVDRRLNFAEIDFVELARERSIAKAALGQPAMERHLAAFKALDSRTGRSRSALKPFDPRAGAAGRALAAAAAGFAPPRADAAADAGTFLAGARTIGEFVELHRRSPCASTTRTKCFTLAIMPRVCGVSGNSTTRPMRLRPSPISVSRWV